MIENIRNAYDDSLMESCEEIAFEVADNAALGEVVKEHNVKRIRDITKEMREEATKLRILAIGR